MSRLARSSAAFLLALGFLLPAAWAGVSRDEAATLAQRAVPGRVLAVEHGVDLENKVIWRVRLLTSGGELRVVLIDANSGKAR